MWQALSAIFDAFWAVCRLRKGPQDLPASGEFLAVVLGAYFLLAAGLWTLYLPVLQAGLAGLLETGLLALATWILVRGRRCPERYPQTMTALAGSGILFGLIGFPWLLVMRPAEAQGADGNPLVAGVVLALVIWNVVVWAHVMRQALNIPFAAAFGISLAYLFGISAAIEVLLSGGGPS